MSKVIATLGGILWILNAAMSKSDSEIAACLILGFATLAAAAL